MNDTTKTLLTEEPPKPLSTVADLPKTWQPFAANEPTRKRKLNPRRLASFLPSPGSADADQYLPLSAQAGHRELVKVNSIINGA